MKKIILAAVLCVVAAVVAPVATASASFKGKCVGIKGTAEFKVHELKAESQTGIGYSFDDKGQGICIEEGVPVTPRKIEKVTVTGGTFVGSCLGAGESEVVGSGKLKVEGLAELSFDLAFKSNNGVVSLKVLKSGTSTVTATGEATFFNSVKEPSAQCLSSGVKELEFEAHAEGEIG
jgi:hypothetical protein